MKKPVIFYVTKALYPSGSWFFLVKTNFPCDSEKSFVIEPKMFAGSDDEYGKSGNKISDMIRHVLERELDDEYTEFDFKFMFNAEFSILGDAHPVFPNNAGIKFHSHQTQSSMRVPLTEEEVRFFYGITKDILNLNCEK